MDVCRILYRPRPMRVAAGHGLATTGEDETRFCETMMTSTATTKSTTTMAVMAVTTTTSQEESTCRMFLFEATLNSSLLTILAHYILYRPKSVLYCTVQARFTYCTICIDSNCAFLLSSPPLQRRP